LVSRVAIGIAVVVIIAAVGGYYYLSQQATTVPVTTTPTKTATPTQASDGEKLYEANCAGCHGAKGVGGTAIALSASNANRTIIEKGNLDKGMPAFENKLTPEEISAILDYLRS